MQRRDKFTWQSGDLQPVSVASANDQIDIVVGTYGLPDFSENHLVSTNPVKIHFSLAQAQEMVKQLPGQNIDHAVPHTLRAPNNQSSQYRIISARLQDFPGQPGFGQIIATCKILSIGPQEVK